MPALGTSNIALINHISILLSPISHHVISSYCSCSRAITVSHSQCMKSFTPNDSTHLIIFLPLGQSTHPLNHRQTKTQPSSPNNYWCATNIDNYQLIQQLAEWRGAQRGLNCYQLTAPLSIVAMFERHNVLTLSAGCWVAVLICHVNYGWLSSIIFFNPEIRRRGTPTHFKSTPWFLDHA